jgi:hypothetical protein
LRNGGPKGPPVFDFDRSGRKLRSRSRSLFEVALVLVRLDHVAGIIVNANDEKRFVVRADEILTAFVELKRALGRQNGSSRVKESAT